MKKEIIQPSDLDVPGRRAFSHGIKIGNTVYIAGQLATNREGMIVGLGDIVAQTRWILKRFESILKQVGGRLSNVVSVVVYLKDIRDFDAFCDVRRDAFKTDFPTSTAIQVAGFVAPEALIEISAVAVLE